MTLHPYDNPYAVVHRCKDCGDEIDEESAYTGSRCDVCGSRPVTCDRCLLADELFTCDWCTRWLCARCDRQHVCTGKS